MSDKTKMLHDQALIRRRFAEQQARDAAKPHHDLRCCVCRIDYYQITIYACPPDGFYCLVCIPDKHRAEIGPP